MFYRVTEIISFLRNLKILIPKNLGLSGAVGKQHTVYPKSWDRNACANSVDPNQTAPQEQSDLGHHRFVF